jgi:plasmid stability protein
MAKTTIELPEGLHRTLRVKAAVENRSMNDIVLEALAGYLHDFRLSPDLLQVETVPRSVELDERIEQRHTGGTR